MSSYIFTTESVTNGRPDKVCDLISESIPDVYPMRSLPKRSGRWWTSVLTRSFDVCGSSVLSTLRQLHTAILGERILTEDLSNYVKEHTK